MLFASRPCSRQVAPGLGREWDEGEVGRRRRGRGRQVFGREGASCKRPGRQNTLEIDLSNLTDRLPPLPPPHLLALPPHLLITPFHLAARLFFYKNRKRSLYILIFVLLFFFVFFVFVFSFTSLHLLNLLLLAGTSREHLRHAVADDRCGDQVAHFADVSAEADALCYVLFVSDVESSGAFLLLLVSLAL